MTPSPSPRFSFFCPVRGGPGRIRGDQMAHKLGGRFNPVSDYDGDVCVWVMTTPLTHEPPLSFYDPVDGGFARLSRVKRWKGPVIALTWPHRDYMARLLPGRDIRIIPEHHCNFDRQVRPADRPVRRVGCIGGLSAFQHPHSDIDAAMRSLGLEWEFCPHYHSRDQVVDFYSRIDIQLVYRPVWERVPPEFGNPLKLANAGSFGIPTIAYPEVSYTAEWEHECVWAYTIYDMVKAVKMLADDPYFYSHISSSALRKAESYHIDHISSLYRSLV